MDVTRSPGGIPARNSKGERLILYLGIIDILQSYRFAKKFEHAMKSIVADGVRIVRLWLESFLCAVMCLPVCVLRTPMHLLCIVYVCDYVYVYVPEGVYLGVSDTT